eukprot:scaffold41463_cov75-Phaeocystis_antarctica.AAC.4
MSSDVGVRPERHASKLASSASFASGDTNDRANAAVAADAGGTHAPSAASSTRSAWRLKAAE